MNLAESPLRERAAVPTLLGISFAFKCVAVEHPSINHREGVWHMIQGLLGILCITFLLLLLTALAANVLFRGPS